MLLPAANRGFRRTCEEFGLLAETVEEREIGGWVYLRVVPLGGRDPRPLPDWALRALMLLLPGPRRRVRACGEAARTDKAGRCIERWHAEWKPALQHQLAMLTDTDIAGLSDPELNRHLLATGDLLDDSQRIHMLLNHSVNVVLAELAFAAKELLGWSEDRTFALVAGLSDTSSAPGRAIDRLAELARSIPVVETALEEPSASAAVATADPVFAAAFREFQRWFGARTIGYDVADPTLAERPDVVLSQVRDTLRNGARSGTAAAALADRRRRELEEARRVLVSRGPEDGARFERALRRAELAYPVREEHGFLDTMMPLALARFAALEVGRRLASRGQIQDPADVFFLEAGEARHALASGAPHGRRVEQRMRERAHALAHPGPASYGEAPLPPALRALPADVRFVHEAVQWSYDRVFEPSAASRVQPERAIVRGTGASPGRFTGPVRVVLDETGFDRIQDGDILVCPTASPVWSVLFPRLGALVTDAGGALSHCAIIAREFGVPAVVATGNATRVLRDGRTATVDGMAGTVTVHATEKG